MKKKPDYKQLLQMRRYNPDFTPDDDIPIFTIDKKIIGNNQNLVTLQAKQKSGKTTFSTAAIASALTGDPVFRILIRLAQSKKRVAFFDTEQGQADFYKTIRKIKSLANLQTFPHYFDAYNMREDDPDDIIGAINEYVDSCQDIGLLLIDNSTDLLNSFNDESESKTKIQNFKRWTKKANNLAIQCLHTGRSGENSLGHYGAFTDRASQSVLHIEKTERGTVVCKPKYMRSDEDFEPIELIYNKDIHNWQETFYIDESEKSNTKVAKASPGDYDGQKHRSLLSYIFQSEGIICSHDDLMKGIAEVYAVPRQWAKECVVHLLKEGIIFRLHEGYTMTKQARLFISQPA